MLRRKLSLYTLLYIAGIAAGFFMFERSRAFEAAGFSVAVIAALLFSDGSASKGSFAKKENRASGQVLSCV